jgi:hypothetical protein
MQRQRNPLPLPLLSGRLHDHEQFLLAWSVLVGVTYALGAPPPLSLADSIPEWMFISWAVIVGLSGLIGLAGCHWRGRIDVALEIERAALLMQGGCWLLFAGCIMGYAGLIGLTAAGIVIAWAGANLSRAWRITKALAADRVEQAEGGGAHE